MLLWLLFSVAVATASARDLVTIDGEHFREIESVQVADYTVKFQHEAGLATLPLAALSDADLAVLAPRDRSKDGRFWYERAMVLVREWKKSGEAGGRKVEEVMLPLAPYTAVMAEYAKSLAEARRQETARLKAANAQAAAKEAADRAAREAVDEWNRQIVEYYTTERGLRDLLQGRW